jgi:hypothetical protein
MPETTGSDTLTGGSGWTGLLDHYRQTAVRILGSHLRSGAECSSCGQQWPCRAACAAEIALEL